jgi:3-hydroxyacyl-[acyl-carrier-protein] dehydratase
MNKILIDEIINILPHRYPFILIDRVIDYKKNEYIQTIKNVTINEHFFVGHFPNKPIMPGVLIIEAIAQSMGILAIKSFNIDNKDGIFYFAGIDKTKFKLPITPGDQIVINVNIIKTRNFFWKAKGTASVNSEIAVSCELSAIYKSNI